MAGMRYQPQGLARINPSHASARGLGSLVAPLSGSLVDQDIAANILTAVSSSSLSKGAGPIGRCYVCAPTRAKATTGFKMARVGTGDFTFLIVVRANDSNFRVAVGPKKVYGGMVANQGAWKYSNGFAFTESGSSVNTTRPQVVILTRRAGVNYMCVDGKVSSGTAETTNYDQDEVSLFCRGGFDNDSTFSGDLYLFAGWYRGMSDAEMRALSNSPSAPWQLFADPEEDDELPQRSVVNSSIIVTPAALLLSGSELAMRASRRVAAQPSALAVVGGNVALRSTRKLGAQPAALDTSLGQVALKAGRRLLAQPAATILTAGGAGLKAMRRIGADAASLALQSGSAHLRASRRLTVACVEMTVTGGSIQFQYTPAPSAGSYVMAVTSGALSLTSGSVGVRVTRRVSVAPAALTLSAGDARLLVGYRLAVDPVVLAMFGGPALLRAAPRLQVGPAQLAITDGNVTLRYSQQIEYARAPAGSGYSPQRVEIQSRPAQLGGSRPASIQRNDR